jgi:aspartate aminotransferase
VGEFTRFDLESDLGPTQKYDFIVGTTGDPRANPQHAFARVVKSLVVTEQQLGTISKHASKVVLGAAASTIRKMFELADQLRLDGNGPVFDLSLGNPSLEPPACWKAAMHKLLDDPAPGRHRYMVNAGLPEVRAFVAKREADRYGVPFTAKDVTMTAGAACALNVVFRAIVDPDDEVVVPAPYFPEYDNYCDNVGARLVAVPTLTNFELDIEAIVAAASRPKARVVIINSPNNPTGALYSQASLDELAKRLREVAAGRERTLYVLEDSPYRDLTFDGSNVPSILGRYDETIFLSSHSKDIGLAGERIGYALIAPTCKGRELLQNAFPFFLRSLGVVNAPALVQRSLPLVLGRPDGRVDVSIYANNCKKMADGLRKLGYTLETPRAGFFLFPGIPARWRERGDQGDVDLAQALLDQRTIVVPGGAFGAKGHLRLAMCVDPSVVDGALAAFERVG